MKNYDRQPIFKIYIAQQLLRLGNPIVDVARDKHNADKAIFFFEKTEKFFRDWKYIRDTDL